MLLVAEPDFLAVREEDERHAKLIGIALALGFARSQADARASSSGYSKRTAEEIRQIRSFPLRADLTALPPLLVHVGSAETLLDDAVGISSRAGAANRPVIRFPAD